MDKLLKRKVLKKYSALEWVLASFAAAFCLCAFCMFFADGITDAGGDGKPVYLITFDLRVDGLHFNALAFFAYILPLIAALFALIPFKCRWHTLVIAVAMLYCGVVQMCLREVYFIKYSAEIASMYRAAGVVTSQYAYLAGAFSLIAALLLIAKFLLPIIARKHGACNGKEEV